MSDSVNVGAVLDRSGTCRREPGSDHYPVGIGLRHILLGGVFLAVTLFAKSGYAGDLREVVTPWRDPLLTRPPVLTNGQTLPGDSAPISCAPPDAERIKSQALTLAEAVDIGLCANPQVRSAWAAIKVQAAALGEARSGYLPTVSAGFSRVDDRTSYSNKNINSVQVQGEAQNLGLNWHLLDFGSRAANNRAAAALLDAAVASHNAALQKTLESLVGAFFDTQTAQAVLQSRLASESLARSTLDAAQRREKRGAGAQSDTLQATTSLARAVLDRSRAQGDLRKAVASLSYALGIDPGTPLQLASELDDANHDLGGDLSGWLKQAQNAHPAILAAQHQLEAARHKVVAMQSDGLPSIDLSANLYQNGRPNQGLPSTLTHEEVATVTLNIPLFEGFGRTYKVRGAQAQVEQSQASQEDVTNQVLMNVVKTYADANAALVNLDASNTLLQAAQNALTSVQRKFDRGAADILEILATQSALADAQQQRVRCLSDWRSARLRLLASVGQLGHGQFAASIVK